MEPTPYDKVVEAVKALTAAEQWRLRDLLDVLLEPPGPPISEEEFEQELLREGILDQVGRKMDPAAFRAYKPVEVKGKPVSETIIEERREVPAYFFDSSALVKCYLQETGSAWVRSIFDPASGDMIGLVRLTGAEVVSAICRRGRGGAITPVGVTTALARFRYEFALRFEILPVTARLTSRAMTLAENHGLRGYDAVQLAAGLLVHHRRLRKRQSAATFVSADTALNAAAATEGLPIDDPNAHP